MDNSVQSFLPNIIYAGNGMSLLSGVILCWRRRAFWGFPCRTAFSISFLAIFTVASASPFDWG